MTTGKNTSIGEALDYWLNSLVLTPTRRIAQRNLTFVPEVNEIYLRPTVLHANTDFGDIGARMRRHRGIYLVGVFGPVNTGPTTQSEIADLIVEHFVSETISRNGVNVRIGTPDGGPGVPSQGTESSVGGWRNIPVSIPWWCDTY